jgi:hypothetical protein
MTREEALAEGRRLRGPPYRMTIEYPHPPLSKEEEAAALAQAKYDGVMGNVDPDPKDYITLHAHNIENAKQEAEERWRCRLPISSRVTILRRPRHLLSTPFASLPRHETPRQ